MRESALEGRARSTSGRGRLSRNRNGHLASTFPNKVRGVCPLARVSLRGPVAQCCRMHGQNGVPVSSRAERSRWTASFAHSPPGTARVKAFAQSAWSGWRALPPIRPRTGRGGWKTCVLRERSLYFFFIVARRPCPVDVRSSGQCTRRNAPPRDTRMRGASSDSEECDGRTLLWCHLASLPPRFKVGQSAVRPGRNRVRS